MRKRHLLLAVIVLFTLPAMTGCDLFDSGKSDAQLEYERQLEIIQQQQEANQRAQEEYYRQQREAIEQYLKDYAEWEAAQQEARRRAIQEQQEQQQTP